MSIVKLNNPKTKLYNNLKNLILGCDFEWKYLKADVDTDRETQRKSFEIMSKYVSEYGIDRNEFQPSPFYVHPFIQRPDYEFLFPRIKSSHMFDVNQVICEILNCNIDTILNNNMQVNMMCRCVANAKDGVGDRIVKCSPHVDHNFPHKNMLIYLTDAGGSTFVEGEEFAPEEDDVIIFEGIHWHELPKKERRVVLVMTYV